MSLITTQNITLDLTVPKIKNVRCVEDDSQSRIIRILVTDNGDAWPLDKDSMTVNCKIHKPDHTFVYNKAAINDDGTVTIILSDQAMAVPGILHSELQVCNGTVISTMPFHIVVEKSVLSNKDIASANESDVINSMLTHMADIQNPHQTTKTQVGLGNADNTSDADKPVSIAQQAALDKKLDKTTVADSFVLGLVKSGTDITVDADGNVSVNDNSHNHTASNISDLSDFSQTEISKHNTSADAHYDIREFISELNTRLNALADSDDTTLDQLSEIVAYIKSNRSLIENITTSKINVSDIVDHLTSTAADKPLSANQGKVLNDLIAALTTIVGNKVDQVSGKDLSSNDYTTEEKNKLNGIASGAEANVQADWSITDSESDAYIKNKPVIPTKTSELINDSGFTDNYTHPSSEAGEKSSGFYKIATDFYGHITDAVEVNKTDITALGIPEEDTWRGIQDNLTSDSTEDSLSAAQGKLLKALLDGKADNSHAHNYAGSSSAGGSATSAVKLNSSAGSAAQPVYFSNGVPVACTYTLGKSVPSNAVFTDTNTWRGIVNNLTSTSTTDSLSAAQGKALKALVDGKAASSHSHNYVPLSGGTMTGNLVMNAAINSHSVVPTIDSNYPLGGSDKKFSNIYCKNGTIHTSDRNKKCHIEAIPNKYMELFYKLKPAIYKYKDGDRIHVGAISQDVEEAMASSGINALEFGGFCKDIHYVYEYDSAGNEIESSKRPQRDENGNTVYDYSMRYQEYIFLTVEAIHRLKKETEQQIGAMKQQIADLQSQLRSALETTNNGSQNNN